MKKLTSMIIGLLTIAYTMFLSVYEVINNSNMTLESVENIMIATFAVVIIVSMAVLTYNKVSKEA